MAAQTFQWIKSLFVGWTFAHFVFDFAVGWIATAVISHASGMGVGLQVSVFIAVVLAIVAGTAIITSMQRRAAIMGRRLADKSGRLNRVTAIMSQLVSEGEVLEARDAALQWRESVLTTVDELFGPEAAGKFKSVSIDLEKPNCDLKLTLRNPLAHLKAKLARMHEGSIRSD